MCLRSEPRARVRRCRDRWCPDRYCSFGPPCARARTGGPVQGTVCKILGQEEIKPHKVVLLSGHQFKSPLGQHREYHAARSAMARAPPGAQPVGGRSHLRHGEHAVSIGSHAALPPTIAAMMVCSSRFSCEEFDESNSGAEHVKSGPQADSRLDGNRQRRSCNVKPATSLGPLRTNKGRLPRSRTTGCLQGCIRRWSYCPC
jgi:hypothetical protein